MPRVLYEASPPPPVQLPEVAPPLSLRLSQAVWGVDPSTLRVAVGVVKPYTAAGDRLVWDTLSLEQRDRGARRLRWAHRELVPWFGVWADEHPPQFVLVEQPFGKHVHPESYFMVGVVLAAVAEAVGDRVPVGTCSPPEWKKLALGAGRGGADKEQVLVWARAAGYTGGLQDEADAVAIATAAGVRCGR